jgi:hypothetical protein
VHHEFKDFNGADEYFKGTGSAEWRDIHEILKALVPRFQPSRQAGKEDSPIFDPKGTNLALNEAAATYGWSKVPVPLALRAFGNDWDAGKGGVLAEWQFSNYPFLWNNVIRTEAVFMQQSGLVGVNRVDALLIVAKSGVFPSSNSSLYYEQAAAQLDLVTVLEVFDVPIRLVGLGVPSNVYEIDAEWTTYADRTSRTPTAVEPCQMEIAWTGRMSKYGSPSARVRRI